MSKEMKGKCPYCGKNPVSSHFLYWYFESLNIFFAPLRRALLYSPFSRFCKKIVGRLDLAWTLVGLGKFLYIISIQPSEENCKVPRAKVLWQEAVKRGIKMQELLLFGRPFDTYIASKRTKNQEPRTSPLVFSGLPRPENYDDSALDWMDDKWLFKKKMMEHGLPVAKGGVAWNFWQAKKIFTNIQSFRGNLKSETLNL